MAQHFAIFGVAVVFVIVGLTNRARGKGPWIALLCGGVAMGVMELLSLLGIVKV